MRLRLAVLAVLRARRRAGARRRRGWSAGRRPRPDRAPERGRGDDRRPDQAVAAVHGPGQLAARRRRARRFPDSFANWPLCCPSRATFLTGQYAHNHRRARQPAARRAVSTRSTTPNTLPVWLQAAGYHTIHVGKYLNGYGGATPRPEYVPARVERVVRGDLAGRRRPSTTTSLNENGTLVNYGADRGRVQAGRVRRTWRRR